MGADVKFGADTTGFTRGVGRIKNDVRGLGSGLVSSLGGGLKGILAGVLAGFSVRGIKGIFDEVDRAAKMAVTFGDTSEGIQKISVAAKLAGTDVERVGRSFNTAAAQVRQLAAGLTPSGGSGKISESLKDLNINAKDFVSASLTDQIMMVVRGMENMDNPTKAAGAALDLLGNRASDLIPLLSGTSAELEKLMENTSVVSNEDSAKIEKFNNSMVSLGNTLKVFGAGVGLKAVGILQGVTGAFQMLTGQFDKADKNMEAFESNFFGKERNKGPIFSDGELTDKQKFDAAEDVSIEQKLIAVREDGMKKLADMRARHQFEAMTREEQITELMNRSTRALTENDYDGAVTALDALNKLSIDEVKDREKAEQEIADARKSGLDAIDSLEKGVLFERLSTEEKISKLRADAIEAAKAGDIARAAEIAGNLTDILAEENSKLENTAAGAGNVIADSLRRVGLGGVAVSATIDRQILDINRDQLGALREIRTAIATQDNRVRFR